MPWLPIYADSCDMERMCDWLNASEEVAFIVPCAPGRWRAVSSVPSFDSDRVCLWHVPSGPLPLLHPHPSKEVGAILDPWSGWQELRIGADPQRPYFGAGHPGVIWLNVRALSRRSAPGIGLSSFEWIGNRYRLIGNAAEASTEKFWRSLRRWVQKQCQKIPRYGPIDGPGAEIFTFPSAQAAFESGVGRDAN